MIRWIPLILICLLTACTQPALDPEKDTTPSGAPGYGDITGEQLLALVGTDTVIVDVRTPEEYASGHVEGALNMPLDKFQSDFASLALDATKPLAVYCRSGNRSLVAYQILVKEGFDKVYHAPGVSQYDYPLVQ